jgi:hypothetical protein
LLVPLAAASLAGCTAWWADDPCDDAAIPHPRGGATASYVVEGVPSLPGMGTAAGEWAATNPGAPLDGALTLPRGSRLDIAIGHSPEPRIDTGGTLRPAWRVAYEASHPAHANPLPYLVEWLDAETGQLVQSSLQHIRFYDGASEHGLDIGLDGHPAVLMSSPLWGLDREMLSHVHLEYPALITPVLELETLYLDYDLAAARQEQGVCLLEFEVTGTFWAPVRAQLNATMIFSSDHPFPIQIESSRARIPSGTELAGFEARLLDYREGAGGALPRQTPAAERSHLPVTIAPDNVPLGSGDVFPMAIEEALARARSDEAWQDWAASKEEVAVSQIQHRMGPPERDDVNASGSIIDEWTIVWTARDDEAVQSRVRDEIGPLGLPISTNPYARTSQPFEYTWVETPPTRSPTFPAMAEVHRAFYGFDAEVAVCFFHFGYCTLFTHEPFDYPYAGDYSGVGGIVPGLKFSLETGEVFQEVSRIPDVV